MYRKSLATLANKCDLRCAGETAIAASIRTSAPSAGRGTNGGADSARHHEIPAAELGDSRALGKFRSAEGRENDKRQETWCARGGLAITRRPPALGAAFSLQDVENEMQCSRWRVQAECKLGEILKRMAENGERKIQGNAVKSRDATSLEELGIPKDRASRAMQLADVPQVGHIASLTATYDAPMQIQRCRN